MRLKDGRIVAVDNACSLCETRLLGQSHSQPATAEIDGQAATTSAAIEHAVKILAASRAPLICGLAGSTVETQRAAVALADHLGATIDPSLPAFHRAAIQAMQSVGVSTCTLGEVKQRVDLVIFWGADPATTHPSLYKRFLDPPGEFVSKRHIINISAEQNQNRADKFLSLQQENNYVALAALRALIAGTEIQLDEVDGVSINQLHSLATRLQDANYSVFFFGPEIGGVAETEALFLLVRQLNARSRCAAIGLGGTQCENALAWQTGYPCGVNFALGYPRYDPHAYSANTLLERGEVDAVVVVGSEGLDQLSTAARARLGDIPVILLENAEASNALSATVRMTTAVPGVHCGGTVFRMDGVPLRLRPIFDSPLPLAATLLAALQERVS